MTLYVFRDKKNDNLVSKGKKNIRSLDQLNKLPRTVKFKVAGRSYFAIKF